VDRGKFIVFEGIDGSGKSTHAKLITDRLNAYGIKAEFTFEPTSGETGLFLRKYLSGELKGDERTVAALFMADRMEHLLNADNGIIKKINSGISVICDRYYLSSVAYNCHSEGIEWVMGINERARALLMPDLTIFLDTHLDNAVSRISKRKSQDIYEKTDIQKIVRARYIEAFSRLKDERVVRITGDRGIDSVNQEIWNKIIQLYK